MVASLSVRVYTGSSAGTESAVVTGIDFISADNATNSLANRQANTSRSTRTATRSG